MTPPRRRTTLLLLAAAGMLAAALPPLAGPAFAAGGATPASGSVGPGNSSSASWTFDSVAGAGLGGTPIEVVCAPGDCSKYALTVKLPQPDSVFYATHEATLTFRCSWNSPAPTDLDCFAFSPSGGETGPGKPDTTNSGPNYEEIVINDPASGVWSLRVDASASAIPTTSTGHAALTYTSVATVPVQVSQPSDAQFVNYDFSPSYQTRDGANRPNAGEPSLGVDWATGNLMYMAGNQVTRLTYDKARPPVPTATDVTPANSQVNEDAILFTDRTTHRTWALGLLLAGSYLAYTDDDGATWTPGVAFAPPAFPDHDTLGAGPYHTPAPAHTYPHAVYYCAQTIVQDAYCARSDDGGVTFNSPATPLWNGTCSPIHGHVRVGPTGMVYVPNDSCTDAKGVARSGIAVSADNGAGFTVSMPPDSSPGTSDPSVMEGPDGIIYFGYQGSSGHPMIATATHDGAGHVHWRPSVDVGRFADPGQTEDGLPHGIQNTEFSEVVTGSPGRAAYAFLGTGQQGAYQDGSFTGTWYLFVSYTFDGGAHWRTVNATPNDPVQRGCVWNGGLVNACRNMLDFNDIGIDPQGHVFVAYTDGCTTSATYSCDKTPGVHGWNDVTAGSPTGCPVSEQAGVLSTSTCTFARLSAVVRQVCGRGLIASSDPGFHESPACATTNATSTGSSSPGSTPGRAGSTLPATGGGLPWGLPVGVIGLALGAVLLRRRARA